MDKLCLMLSLLQHLKRPLVGEKTGLFLGLLPVFFFPTFAFGHNLQFFFWPNFWSNSPAIIKPIPTFSPVSFNVTSLPTPTIKPTSIQTPKPTSTPQVTAQPIFTRSPNSLNTQRTYIFNQINQFRVEKGLPAVKTDANTCNFAQTRAQEITAAFNHDGFTNRIDSHSLPYPTYSLVNENIAQTQDYKQVETMWANSPGHNTNMSADITYACVGESGNYFAMEGWEP